MIMNEEEGTMELELRDLEFILQQYLRSYQYYHNNKNPSKIVIPQVPSVIDAMNKQPVPIEFQKHVELSPQRVLSENMELAKPVNVVKKEKEGAPNRQLRTSGDREPTEAGSPSDKDASEPNKEE